MIGSQFDLNDVHLAIDPTRLDRPFVLDAKHRPVRPEEALLRLSIVWVILVRTIMVVMVNAVAVVARFVANSVAFPIFGTCV